MSRTLVIGDVHGCLVELEALLAACEHRPGERVVFVGDLVAKGPSSRGVLRRAVALGAEAVLGNHDVHVLRFREAQRLGKRAPKTSADHRAVAESLSADDWRWLESRPYTLRLPEFGVLVVHAGLVPGVALEAQRTEDLVAMRSLLPDGTASKRLEAGVPWASRWTGPEHVIFGHDAVSGLQRHAHATGIDTGCVYGRSLTACVLPGHELVSVPATRAWASVD